MPDPAVDETHSRLEQERLRALVTNIALGVLVEDERRMVALANDAFCQFFDIPVPPAQLVGTSCEAAAVQVSAMLRDPESFGPRIQQLISGRVSAVADEIVFRDGRVLERDYVPIAVDSVRRGHLWLFRDVTQSRRLAQLEREEALQQAQAELSRVARVTTLGELAASIAHEINQPISAMVADASACLNRLGAERPDLGKIRESLNAIVADGARAGEVLTRIRALLARSELTHRACSINHVVTSSVALSRAELARHGFVVEVCLGAADETVLGDAVELQQVLLNLLLNASEAARELPAERRRIVIESKNQEERGQPSIALSVRDFGVGIDPEKRDRLFSAFYSTKLGGLGMGLSITRSIVDRHGGRVWAQSNPDHGATFTVLLPASPLPA